MADYEKPLIHVVDASGNKIPATVAMLTSGGGGGGGGGGDASAANQVTGNTSLASIDGKTPALGQALASASTPVVLPATQITALTPPTSVGISGTLPAFTTTPTFNIGTAPNLTFTNTSFIANAGTNLNTSALALESGGNLAGINSKLPTLSNGKIPVEVASLNVTLDTGSASLEISNDVGNPIPISDAGGSITVDGTFWQATQPVSAASLPLPTGAATAAKQPALGTAGTASTDVITVQGIAGGIAQPVTISALPALASGTNTIGAISNTSFASTQSGTWNVTNITGTVSLPTGAATSANQSTANTSLSNIDGKLPTLSNGKIPVEVGSLNVTVSNASLEIANDVGSPVPISDAGGSITVDGTFWQATQPISADSLPLPSGAATSANQTTANTSLSSIDGKIPALGQALATASTPVVLPSAMVTDLKSVNITGTLPAFAATPTVNIGTAPSLTFTNTSFTANAGTNLNTSALALESGGNLAAINTKLPSGLTVTATRLLVDGSEVTQPVSIATLPALGTGTNNIGSITNITGTVSLPTGAATSANQSTSNTSLASIDGKLPASLGAKAASASLAVTPAFAATSTLTNVASSATSVTLLAANNNRKTVIIVNDSTSDLYVTLNASAASTTNFSFILAGKGGGTPSSASFTGEDYSGQVTGIWASANGNARITETA